MKNSIRYGIYCIAALFLFLGGGTWFYYSRQKPYSERFTAAIVPRDRVERVRWIPIRWAADASSDRTAMYLPIHVDTISKPFLVQFDLGTPVTDLGNITDNFPYLKSKERLLSRRVTLQDSGLYYSGLDITIGDSLRYSGRQIPIYGRLDIGELSESDSMYETKIGSIGYDAIADRILLIDFRRSRIAIVDTLSEALAADVEYIDGALVNQFPIYLPIDIDGHRRLMKYDNGASAFTLWTYRDEWNAWRDGAARVDSVAANSWGVPVMFYRSRPKVPIVFLNRDRSALPIWTTSKAVDNGSFLIHIKQFTDLHFGSEFPGWIGNEYFRDDVLVLDARHNRAGLLRHGVDAASILCVRENAGI